jgi:CDP-diacylglycerol--serine O-phosphatidyltransferase
VNRIKELVTIVGWPGLVSLASLAAAWTAIGFLWSDNSKLTIVFSVIAFLLDILDGALARRIGHEGPFGRQLDSMVDAINYSLLAGLVTSHVLIPGILGGIVGFVILAFGILRLSLFTLNGFENDGDRLYYRGVITPHLTLTVALLYIATRFVEVPEYVLALILLVIASLQLSTIRTRKTGVLIFWIPASIAIGVGAFVWL